MVTKKQQKQSSIGQYVLGKTIGEGTFGKVRLGTHILTGETVAVKILERERVKEIADVERVAREIHILKRVHHPHIIQLHEIIETPTQLFLIMEYCSGGELFDYIVECTRIPEPEACRFFQQILSGVEQVHRINVVHRDLKPENLLLTEDKSIKIVDFGLSNIYKDGQKLKTACGSPCYASPEMIAGHWYEPSCCDIWSCGVILFALVCGYLPFEDGNTAQLYRKILDADYKPPKFISPAVRDLIALMLTTDPDKRITIAGIREHGWYKQVPDVSRVIIPENQTQKDQELDQEIIDEVVRLGFPREYTVHCLRDNKHNNVTTTYHLLLEKRRRGRALADNISVISSCDDSDLPELNMEGDTTEDCNSTGQKTGMSKSMRKKELRQSPRETASKSGATETEQQGNSQKGAGKKKNGRRRSKGKGKGQAEEVESW